MPKKGNIMGDWFALSIKNVKRDDKIWKARLMIQSQKNVLKPKLVYKLWNLRQQAIWILVFLAGIFGFRLCSHNMSQVYLHNARRTTRTLYYTRFMYGIKVCSDRLFRRLKLPIELGYRGLLVGHYEKKKFKGNLEWR